MKIREKRVINWSLSKHILAMDILVFFLLLYGSCLVSIDCLCNFLHQIFKSKYKLAREYYLRAHVLVESTWKTYLISEVNACTAHMMANKNNAIDKILLNIFQILCVCMWRNWSKKKQKSLTTFKANLVFRSIGFNYKATLRYQKFRNAVETL